MSKVEGGDPDPDNYRDGTGVKKPGFIVIMAITTYGQCRERDRSVSCQKLILYLCFQPHNTLYTI
jgi:hypothetical protein